MGKHKNFYRFEMEDEEHAELLRLLLDVKGKVILSGYENDIYKDYLTEWKKFDVESQVSSQKGGSVKRSETIWLNPACTESQEQLRLM